MPAATTSRLLTLLSLLQSGRDWSGADIAERLGTSRRTTRRDIDRLRELGYTIETTRGPDGGYRLDAGSELPPLLFDDDQVVALAVALRAATVMGAGVGGAAQRALVTVRQVMPPRLRHRLDVLEFTPMPGDGEAGAASLEDLRAVSAAVDGRVVLRFDYRHPDGETPSSAGPTGASAPPRRVEPHHLVTRHGRWYLVAWDLDRDDWRVFRVDRLTPRIPTGPRFTPRAIPGGDVADFLAARFKGSEEVDAWPCSATVVLHRAAREVRPFVDAAVEELGPDRSRTVMGSWSWTALAARLNLFDAEVEVLDAPPLRAAFAALAERNAATAAAG